MFILFIKIIYFSIVNKWRASSLQFETFIWLALEWNVTSTYANVKNSGKADLEKVF